VVSRATAGEQQILSSTVIGLADAESLPAPSIVIVGLVTGSYQASDSNEAEAIADISRGVKDLGETADRLP
jgi:siroheme synthase